MREKRKINKETAIAAFFASLGLLGLFGLGIYFLYCFPLSKNSFIRLIPWVIFILIMIPLIGCILAFISKNIRRD